MAVDTAPFALIAVWLVVLLAAPVGGLAWAALTDDLPRHLREPSVQAAIRLSLATSAVSTVVIVATGTPLAYLLAQSRFPGRGALQALVDLPIVLPPMVAGIAMLQMVTGLHDDPLTSSGAEPDRDAISSRRWPTIARRWRLQVLTPVAEQLSASDVLPFPSPMGLGPAVPDQSR